MERNPEYFYITKSQAEKGVNIYNEFLKEIENLNNKL